MDRRSEESAFIAPRRLLLSRLVSPVSGLREKAFAHLSAVQKFTTPCLFKRFYHLRSQLRLATHEPRCARSRLSKRSGVADSGFGANSNVPPAKGCGTQALVSYTRQNELSSQPYVRFRRFEQRKEI